MARGLRYWAIKLTAKVAATPIIDLGDEDDPELVLLMLRYLNGSSYSDLRCSMSMPQTLDLGISLFALADQYDVSTLRADIVDWFSMDVRNLMCFEVVPYAFQRLLGPLLCSLPTHRCKMLLPSYALRTLRLYWKTRPFKIYSWMARYCTQHSQGHFSLKSEVGFNSSTLESVVLPKTWICRRCLLPKTTHWLAHDHSLHTAHIEYLESSGS